MLTPQKRLQLAPAAAGFLLTGALLTGTSAHAYEFQAAGLEGTLDTTITFGNKFDLEGYSTPEGLEQNENDGDRAFDKGLVSSTLKLTSELNLKKDNVGFFGRGTAYYDYVLMHQDLDTWNKNNAKDVAAGRDDEAGSYNGLSDEVKDNQGRGVKLQSAYFYGDWTFDGGQKLSGKIGNQTHNWGETIFYAGGLRDLNAYDIALSTLPGSDGDLNIGQGMVSAELQLNEQIALSGFVQYDWEHSIANGRGAFDSDADIFAPGSDFAYYELERFGLKTVPKAILDAANILHAGDLGKVANTDASVDASDSGQWGAKFTFTPDALPKTEFSLYYANYHSSIPFIEAKVTQSSAQNGLGIAGLLTGTGTSPNATIENFLDLISTNPTDARRQGVQRGLAAMHMLANGVDARVIYPEDIKLWGASFNTTVFGYTKIAGELTYRENAPIWIDHPDDILGHTAAGVGNIANGIATRVSQATGATALPDQWYQNIKRVPMWDASLSVIQPFGAVLGTDLMYVVGEAAFQQVSSLKNHSNYIAKGADSWRGEASELNADDRLDRLSWGYNLLLGANWNDVMTPGLNLESTFRFTHDVNGNSHLTGRFEEGEKAINLGLTAKYDAMSANLSWGGDADNFLRKGTITGTVGYTF